MADAGRLKGDPEEKDTKLSNSDMDNTKERESELAQSITEYAEMPKARGIHLLPTFSVFTLQKNN